MSLPRASARQNGEGSVNQADRLRSLCGLDDIRDWYEAAKANGGKPIMVVIDVLAKVRKPTGNKPPLPRGLPAHAFGPSPVRSWA